MIRYIIILFIFGITFLTISNRTPPSLAKQTVEIIPLKILNKTVGIYNVLYQHNGKEIMEEIPISKAVISRDTHGMAEVKYTTFSGSNRIDIEIIKIYTKY